MNVLLVAQYFPPDLGGAAIRAYNVAKGLLLNGCDVTVVAAFPHYPYGETPKEYRWRPLKVECVYGRKIAEEKFDVERRIDKILLLYEELLDMDCAISDIKAQAHAIIGII